MLFYLGENVFWRSPFPWEKVGFAKILETNSLGDLVLTFVVVFSAGNFLFSSM